MVAGRGTDSAEAHADRLVTLYAQAVVFWQPARADMLLGWTGTGRLTHPVRNDCLILESDDFPGIPLPDEFS